MGKQSLLLAVILVLSGLVLYFWESPPALLGSADKSDLTEARPYAIVSNAFTRHYNTEGDLDYTFGAEQLQYFQIEVENNPDHAEDYTLIEHPRLTIFHAGEPWQVQAQQGKFTEENRVLSLWNQVVVSQVSGEITTTLQTAQLTIKPEEKYAYTEDAVEIKTNGATLNAVGMIADLEARKFTLLSSVRGHYESL